MTATAKRDGVGWVDGTAKGEPDGAAVADCDALPVGDGWAVDGVGVGVTPEQAATARAPTKTTSAK
jgi:hypothetical protein